jgi:hypothetical protein
MNKVSKAALALVVGFTTACAPAADDLKARLGGIEEGEVAGVVLSGDAYRVTGRCLERGRGRGFDVAVEVGDLDQRSLEVVTKRARAAIDLACLRLDGDR